MVTWACTCLYPFTHWGSSYIHKLKMQSRNQYEGISIRVLNIAEFPKFGNHR
jgi:hypothetical protein